VAYETSSLIYHAKRFCYVCNCSLFSLSFEIGMAKKRAKFMTLLLNKTIKYTFSVSVKENV